MSSSVLEVKLLADVAAIGTWYDKFIYLQI